MKRVLAVLCLLALFVGCGTLGIGRENDRLGAGQTDLLKVLALVGGLQSGDTGPLCEAVLSSQSDIDQTTADLLLAACRGLLGGLNAPATAFRAGPASVASPAAGSPNSCPALTEELRIAMDLWEAACQP